MSGMTIVVLVVVVVVVAVAAAIVAMMLQRRNTERKHAQAEQLRSQAAAQSGSLSDSRRHAENADVEAQHARIQADRARADAEQAEARAAEAREGMAMDEAVTEDTVREADRLDPEVDHRADDYRPQAPTAGSPADPAAEPALDPTRASGTTGPAHRADGTSGTA